jgi:hypothetical protein
MGERNYVNINVRKLTEANKTSEFFCCADFFPESCTDY